MDAFLPGVAKTALYSPLYEDLLAWNVHYLRKDTTRTCADAMAFSLQRYWKLKEEERLAPSAHYEEELLWANWNPEVPSLLRSTCPIEDEPAPPPSKRRDE